MGRRLPISRNSTREPRKFAGFPREFVTLRVAQFVLKLAHLAISIWNRVDPALKVSYPDYDC